MMDVEGGMLNTRQGLASEVLSLFGIAFNSVEVIVLSWIDNQPLPPAFDSLELNQARTPCSASIPIHLLRAMFKKSRYPFHHHDTPFLSDQGSQFASQTPSAQLCHDASSIQGIWTVVTCAAVTLSPASNKVFELTLAPLRTSSSTMV